MRKTFEREARQQFIIEKASHLYAVKGVEETKMEDIAIASEYTRRTLYSYFRSRDEISLLALIEDLTARWAEQKLAIAGAGTGLDKMMAWGESLYKYTLQKPHSIRLQLYWDLKGIDRSQIKESTFDSFEKINNELADGLRDIFKLGIADGSLRPDLKIDICISQFLYSFRNILNRAISSTYSFASIDPDEYVKHYLDLFKRSIQNMESQKNETM